MFSISIYNSQIASALIDLDFKEYVLNVNKMSNSNINLSLIDLSKFWDKNECCIPGLYLYKYGLNDSIYNKCKEGHDYVIRHVAYTCNKKIKTKKEYYIHPKTFRKLLIKNSDIYIDYFVFIDDCMLHYTDYRKKLNIEKNSKNTCNYVTKMDQILSDINNKLDIALSK